MRRSPSSIPGVLSPNLVITNLNIQSVEPVDQESLKSLQKSEQIAIQITTDTQEAAARHDAERIIAGIDGRDLLS